ncbi:MAG TPA: hypothetical protein VNG33_02445 [Polyangiaceae bacterium]|nr:hypothetical protein [Polyangiaceae bacterium]
MNDFQLVNPENPDLCDPSKSQWYLDPALAERIVEWALSPLAVYQSVLEPSAGRGHLANAIRGAARPVAIGTPFCVDIDDANVEHLRAQGFDADCADFLSYEPEYRFDIAIMNPPFESGQTERHILHALKHCDRVVCHSPLTTLAGKDRREGLWSVAYLKRLVIHSSRPKYSGSLKGGMTDMCTLDVVRRPELHPLSVAASGVEIEWWA